MTFISHSLRRRPRAVRRRARRPAAFPTVWLLSLLSIPTLTSCAADDAAGGSTTATAPAVSDSAGITIVTNGSGGWDESEAWRLEPDLQLGELDGPLAFGQVAFVGPGAGEELLVVDRQSALVHVFSGEGRLIRSFGGEGEGPGEFQGPRSARATLDGRIAVAQTFPPILHWVSEEGKLLERWRIPDARNETGTMTAPTFGVWMVTEEGTAVVGVTQFNPGDDGANSVTHLTRYAADPSSEEGTTLLEWSDEQRIVGPGDPIPVLQSRHTWDIGPDGAVAVSPSSSYEVRVLGADGTLERIIRRSVEPIPVSEHVRRSTRENLGQALSEGGASEDMVNSWLDRLDFPDRVPAIQRVWFSEPDGAVWVGVHEAERFRSENEPSAWDVFDRRGAYLGRVPVPDGFTPHVITGKYVFGVWQDELEVPFARRYRIVRSADGVVAE